MAGVSEAIIEARGLTMRYGDLVAVDSIDLDIPQDTCFGLLGPNGAGKTTTIEIMEGLRKPTAGEVRFRGRKLDDTYRDRVGIQFQQTALQEFITVAETLRMFGSLYTRRRPIEELVELCDLHDLMNRDHRKLSGGQRQRLLLALALVNDPDLVFLDEPTTGLDPQARRNFWNLVQRIRSEGRTVVLTTHYMEEAEQLCDEIAIMDHGSIIARDSPYGLIQANFEGSVIRLPASQAVTRAQLPSQAQVYKECVDIPSERVENTIHELVGAGVPLEGLSIHRPNLDDLFLKLTGTSLRA